MSTPLPMALVLEDEREIRHFVRLSLEAEGWQVCEAETIRQALVEARTRRPELVVADMGLPDGDGIDFIRQLRSGSGVLTIVLSARSHAQDKVQALNAGADDFITKPFGTAELLARTRANTRRVRAGRLDAAAVGAPAVMAFIKSGKLRCIATGSAQRIAQLPDVPTVAEQGFPGFEMTQWYGLLAPASLPAPDAAKLAAATAKGMREPTAVERLHADARLPVGNTPAEFTAFIAQEQTRWKAVIARAKITPE